MPGRVVALLLYSTALLADQPPLLELSLDNPTLQWQEEFVLTLNIYSGADAELPVVTIDGMDQFELQGTGKNLLQIPRGKTQKWVLTYTLTANDTGSFKLGPAMMTYQGKVYKSNMMFVNVLGPEFEDASAPPVSQPQVIAPALPSGPKQTASQPGQSPPAQVAPKQTPPPPKTSSPIKKPPAPAQQQQQPPPSKPTAVKPSPAPQPPPEPAKKTTVPTPVVLSAEEIKDKVLILMETQKDKLYRSEGITVTVRLLSQLPVENLQFLEDADFPGFLRYEFPFTSKPKGEVVSHNKEPYASFELLKFLLFPLEDGKIFIPPVRCQLRIRVPSGAYRDADLKVNLERSSNSLAMQVKPSPESAVVGQFVLRNEIVSDEPHSKTLRLILEGQGQLSTFDFPEVKGKDLDVRTLSSTITAKIEGESLLSKKTEDLEILPKNDVLSSALDPIRLQVFNPEKAHLSKLTLPSLTLRFERPGAVIKQKAPFPEFEISGLWTITIIMSLMVIVVYFRGFKVTKPKTGLKLKKIFSRRNEKLQISKSAARKLYQQMALLVARQDGEAASLIETLRRHLPLEEWLNVDRSVRKLEKTAYSPVQASPVTYEEMKTVCERIETYWLP